MNSHSVGEGLNRDAQPDRAESLQWWDGMWAGSGSRYVENVEDVKSQWELYEIVKCEYLRGLFPALSKVRSLECGCGSATVSLHFARRGYDAVMLDFASSALRLARRNFGLAGAVGTFVRGDVGGMPFEANSFDVVMSFGLIEHFVDVRPIIAEMVRVLKPGGLLFLDIVPKRFNVQTVFNIAFNSLAALTYGLLTGKPRYGWGKAVALFRPPYYENTFTMEQYSGWMQQAGCEKVQITGNNPFPRLYFPRAIDRWFIKLLVWLRPAWRSFDRSNSVLLNKFWARAWWAHGYKRG